MNNNLDEFVNVDNTALPPPGAANSTNKRSENSIHLLTYTNAQQLDPNALIAALDECEEKNDEKKCGKNRRY
jgi:hypothetical protein